MKKLNGTNSLPANRYIFCNNCRDTTNHVCQSEHGRDRCDEESSIHFTESYKWRFWICAGCEYGTLEECYTNDGMEDKDGKKEYVSKYFPERTSTHIENKKFKRLPKKLNTIYREALYAYNHKMTVLCAMGVRALLEGICADKGINGENIKQKINRMTIILPQNIVDKLHSLRLIGNQAIHELEPPDFKNLHLAIEICEGLLDYLYELDAKTRQLDSLTSRRT